MIGLDGIALVNVVANPDEAAITGKKLLQTKITHNVGSTWKSLSYPKLDLLGMEYDCFDASCTLHIHGYTERTDSRATYSSPSVVGLLMAVGNVGQSLAPYTESDTFLSRDAGFTWQEVHKDAHLWEFKDSGSLLIMANDEKPVDHLLYSKDEDLNWNEYQFTKDKVLVTSIVTVPTDTSRRFILMGPTPRQILILMREASRLWIASAKIARKVGQWQTAYSAMLQAQQGASDIAFVESAKLVKARGEAHNFGQTVITMSVDPPQVVNSSIFAGYQNVVVMDSRFTEINFYLPDPSDIDLPPLPPSKHSSTFFTGQDKYLQKLKEHFTSQVQGQRKFFLLHGLDGIGKTQICLKFIEENPDLFSDIFWIDASSEKTVDFALTQISSTYSTSPNGRPSARSALDWICQRPNFLMVYDGADGHYSVVENFLPPGNAGNITITSRNIGLKRIALSKNSMEICSMEDEDAISLLLKSAMLDDTDDDICILAQQLVSQLDGIPLAIDQAGAYMHCCVCSIDDYLELYTRYRNELMSNTPGFEGASDYGKSTYRTWDISIKKMEDMAAKDYSQESIGAQSAIKLLRIFGFLDHANISQELFKNAAENYIKLRHVQYLSSSLSLLDDETVFMGKHGEWDKLKFLHGIQLLHSFSFIRSQDHLYSKHLLVNSWSRNCIPKAEVTDHYYKARALLSCSIAFDRNYEFYLSLVPHIRSNVLHGLELNLNSKYYDDEYARFALVFDCAGCWDEAEQLLHVTVHQRKTKLGSDHTDTLTSMANLATIYRNQGRWDEAEKLQMDVMNARKAKIGSDHPDTLTTMANLASTYWNQGKWDEAEKLEMEVMNVRKTKLGSDHPDTLTSMVHLASTYWSQGRQDEAEKLQIVAMNAGKTKLGLKDHPHSLTMMANLASTYLTQGRWDEAEKLQMNVMNASKAKLGSDHPSTLMSMANLASTYVNQGRWDEAEKLQMDVINARKIKLGSDHPDTLNSMTNLAATYREQGRWDEAEQLLHVTVHQRKTKLGLVDHPDTLTSMAHLALTYLAQGRWDEAEKLQMDVMNASKTKLGSDHPSTLLSMANLASTYRNQGRWNVAEKLQMDVLNAFRTKLGLDHPDTLTSAANLASTYWEQGKWDEAEKLQVNVMHAFKAKFGLDHPFTLDSMGSLALTYLDLGRWDEAEKLEIAAMNARKMKFGSDHPDTLMGMGNLASIYMSQGRLDEAEKLHMDIMNARKTKLGLDHPHTLTSMNNLALTYSDQGRWDEAEKLQMDVMNARKTKLGFDHPHTLTSMNNLASTYWNQGRLDKAEKLQMDVMNARKTKLGLDHPDTLVSMDNLALTYSDQGRWDEAEKLQMDVMNAYKTKLGSDHLDTMANLASTYWNQGRWDEAEKLQTDVMNTRKTKLGLDHPDTLISMDNLALTYSDQGRWDEAEKLQMDVMNAYKTKLGSDHLDTLTSMVNLASIYWNQGRWDKAEKLQMDVMNAFKTKLGSDHIDTLSSMAKLALTYSDQGRWDEAEKLQMDVMNARKAKIGSDHPDTLTSMANLASTYWNQGRWDEAKKHQVDVMNARKIQLGSDHPDTLISMVHLASTYRSQGMWGEAEKLQMDVVNARKTKLGLDHPDTLATMANLASTYRNQGRWDDAEKLQKDVMDARKAMPESNYPDTAPISISSLEAISRNEGKLNEATEQLELDVINVEPELVHRPDATLISIPNHPLSNQDLQPVQQDHNPPENMPNSLELLQIQQTAEQEPQAIVISSTYEHFKEVPLLVEQSHLQVVPMPSSSGEQGLEHLAMQPKNKFIKGLKGIWRKLKC
ncbi:hypothetical protein F5887DRAFT_1283371 [Amanita rubescens]|nr:hypothetical protein F5887DRAFT_1283371 [Amanita rubescens]